jgi:tight adherence protein B
MTGAAAALALALLIAPGPPRHRVRAHSERPRPRIPAAPLLTVLVLALAVVVPPGVAVAVAIAVATVEARRRRMAGRRRRAAEAVALQAAVEVLVGELRAGAHPVAAFTAAASEVDDVVAAPMRTVSARARMGADVGGGLRSVARRSSLPAYWERLAVCWQLAHSHGLAIGTLMQTAYRDIAARERFSAQVSAGMAGARTTAAMLAGLPVLGLGLGQLIGADPLTFLLSGGAGQWLLAIGVALSCAGLAWSDVITGKVTK